MPLLRCFSSMSHIIDGVTVANSNQPHADKMMQEKYLQESTLSNMGNFESIQLGRLIDSCNPDHNLWAFDHIDDLGAGVFVQGSPLQGLMKILHYRRLRTTLEEDKQAVNRKFMIFQPPFDFWTKHQRCSGGNHQIQLNLRAASGVRGTPAAALWGNHVKTGCVGALRKLGNRSTQITGDLVDSDGLATAAAGTVDATASSATAPITGRTKLAAIYGDAISNANAQAVGSLRFDIVTCRLLRRMVRYTIERPISVQEFNVTEMQFFHGQASGGTGSDGVTQNFLLPSSTFGLAFYWRASTDSQYTSFAAYPQINGTAGSYTLANNFLQLNQFFFTYGGETYPSQRVTGILKTTSAQSNAYGYQKLQQIAHQLQGVYNTDMERFNSSYGGLGYLDRLDAHAFFFPVAKHNNSDNSDLQVTWDGSASQTVSLVVVAFYDARVELSYNQMNQLEKVTKTEWR